ncbi:MAG: cell division ATP-binding protein FtsE [bacterium]
MISFEHVTKRYGERLALDDVSWRMDEGECVVVLGHSAAGKTTMLRLLTHETQPTSGVVTVGSFRSGRLGRTHRALLRRTIGVVYEDFRLLADRTVFENVAIALHIAGHFEDADVTPKVRRALQEVGLEAHRDLLPAELSYGERQRCAIARAIVNRPALILADEPTGALEPKSAQEILALLLRIHREGAALLVGTTRAEVADAIGGRRLVLADGRLTETNGAGSDTKAYMPPAPSRDPASPSAPSSDSATAVVTTAATAPSAAAAPSGPTAPPAPATSSAPGSSSAATAPAVPVAPPAPAASPSATAPPAVAAPPAPKGPDEPGQPDLFTNPGGGS